LRKIPVIEDVQSFQSGQNLSTERVNHYITDGEMTLANLVVEIGLGSSTSAAP
jgi:hypothetical protein